MAMLVPLADEGESHPAEVEGWLDDDDPFFAAADGIVEARSEHLPRAMASELGE
ncbi:MAG: hypothetical protein MI919_20480 [Holophagales bacterium]|nr:hypothetical protein [Holophagales bacterium]